jgi:hypothetical protein
MDDDEEWRRFEALARQCPEQIPVAVVGRDTIAGQDRVVYLLRSIDLAGPVAVDAHAEQIHETCSDALLSVIKEYGPH